MTTCVASHIILLVGQAVHTTTEYSATATCFETLPNILPISMTYWMALSNPRVESEHEIGIWKGGFRWLHSIPMIMKQSTQKEDLSHMLEVIDTCVILHNFLIKQKEEISN